MWFITKQKRTEPIKTDFIPSHDSTRGAQFPYPWAIEKFQFHHFHHRAGRGLMLATSVGKSMGLG